MLWPCAETCQIPFLLTTTVIESQKGWKQTNKEGRKEGKGSLEAVE